MNINKSEVLRGVLTVLKVTGVVTVAVLAPNVLQVFGKRYKSTRRFGGGRLNRTIHMMEKKGFVKISHKVGNIQIKPTAKGLRKLSELDLQNIEIKPQKKWDNKWRLVIFDIPEQFRQNRKLFQERLRAMGFIMLQKSVWVCPYPCEKQIMVLRNAYSINSFVSLITAEDIDTKTNILKRFNLG